MNCLVRKQFSLFNNLNTQLWDHFKKKYMRSITSDRKDAMEFDMVLYEDTQSIGCSGREGIAM